MLPHTAPIPCVTCCLPPGSEQQHVRRGRCSALEQRGTAGRPVETGGKLRGIRGTFQQAVTAVLASAAPRTLLEAFASWWVFKRLCHSLVPLVITALC